MIQDANALSDGQTLHAAVCIVGAGAAGISMAMHYIDTEVEVLLLEAGGLRQEPQTQALYAGAVADSRAHSPPDRYRQRRFGGTSTIWGGRCMPYDEIDFEPRDYVPNSGWPFKREALLPYYPLANRLCEAGEFLYTADEALSNGGRPIIDGFESADFSDDTLERFSCPTDFGARYGNKLRQARNITVVLHANVTHVQLEAQGRQVSQLAIRTLDGKRLTARASQFVLATGGLEVPRLLLASRDVQPRGIGNDHDVVGRFYMCHLAGTIGAITIQRPLESVYHGYELTDEGIYCRRRFALRAQAQRQHRLGNFVARLHHPRITNPEHRSGVLSLLYLAKPFISYEYAKRLYGDEKLNFASYLRHVGNVLTGPFEASSFAWHMLRDRILSVRKFPSIIVSSKANLYSLDFHAEQQPNPDSRVMLDTSTDELGMPRLLIDWRYTPRDLDTVRQAIALLAAAFQHSGAGKLEYEPGFVESEMTRYGAYGGHHIGTARMGSNLRSSVVNADCRVHGVDNLFIASSAAFPTSSQANPTLSVVAVALRLADHLKDVLKAVTPAVRVEPDRHPKPKPLKPAREIAG